MPRFNVDVKAFISVTVEARSVREARQVADAFAEDLSPADEQVTAHNEQLAGSRVVKSSGFEVEGQSDVDQICDECQEPIYDGECSCGPALCPHGSPGTVNCPAVSAD